MGPHRGLQLAEGGTPHGLGHGEVSAGCWLLQGKHLEAQSRCQKPSVDTTTREAGTRPRKQAPHDYLKQQALSAKL